MKVYTYLYAEHFWRAGATQQDTYCMLKSRDGYANLPLAASREAELQALTQHSVSSYVRMRMHR